MSSVPNLERSEQVQRGKPPPDRSWIEVGSRFTAPRWLYSDSPRTLWHLAVGVALCICLLIGPWAFCTLLVVILTINVMKRSPGPTRRSERARLLADCNAQHAAWKRGNDRVAFFGQFPPPQNWESGYIDGRRAETVEQPARFWNDDTPMPKWLLVGPAYENAAGVGPGA